VRPAVVAVLAVALTVSGCSSHKAASPPSTAVPLIGNGTVSLPSGTYPLAPHDVGVCRVVGVPYRDLLRPAHLTYTDVVTRPLGPVTKAAAAGVSLLQGSNPQVTLGPYGPAVAYAMARYVGTVKHLAVPGADDPKVIASAHTLDRFLRNGGCPG
jgi:hypothetical protein